MLRFGPPRLLPLPADELMPCSRPETPRVGADSPLPQDLVDATIALMDVVSKCQPECSRSRRGSRPRRPSRGKKPPKFVRRATFVNSIAKAKAEFDLAERRSEESRIARHAARQLAAEQAEKRRREGEATVHVQAACRVHVARLELLRLRAAAAVQSCMASLGMSMSQMEEVHSNRDSPDFVFAGCGSGVSSKSSSPWPPAIDAVPGWSPVVIAPSSILSKVHDVRSDVEKPLALDTEAQNEDSLLDCLLYGAEPLEDGDQSRCSSCEAAVVLTESPPARTPEHLQGREVATVSVSPTEDIGYVRWEVAGQSLLESLFAEVLESVEQQPSLPNDEATSGWSVHQIVQETFSSCCAADAGAGHRGDSTLQKATPRSAQLDNVLANTADELVQLLCSGSDVADDKLADCLDNFNITEICTTIGDDVESRHDDSQEPSLFEPVPVVTAMCNELADVAISPDIRSVESISPQQDVVAWDTGLTSTAADASCTYGPCQAADAEVCAVLEQVGDAAAAQKLLTASPCTARACESCGGAPVFPLEQVSGCRRVLPGRAISSCASFNPTSPDFKGTASDEVLEVLESILADQACSAEQAVEELTGWNSQLEETPHFFGNPDAEDYESILPKRMPGELRHVEDEPWAGDEEVVDLLESTLDEVELLEAGFSNRPAERDHGDLSTYDLARLESMDAIDGALCDFVVELNRMQDAVDASAQARVADAVSSAASELAKDECFAAVFHAIQSYADANALEAETADVAPCDAADAREAAPEESKLPTPEGGCESPEHPEMQEPEADVEPPLRVWTPVHNLDAGSSSAAVRRALEQLAESIAAGREEEEAPEVCALVQQAYVEACAVRKVKPNSVVMKTLAATREQTATCENPRTTRSYNFAGAYLGDRGLVPVLLALAHDPGVASTNLSNCGLHATSAEVLADFLRLHPTLCDLDLGGNTALSSSKSGLLLFQALEERRAATGSAPTLRLAGTGLAQLGSLACNGKAKNWLALRPNGLLRHPSARPGKKVDLQRHLAAAGVCFE